MSVKNKGGGTLAVEAFLYTDKKQDRLIPSYIIKLAIAIAGALGTVFSFLSCFDLGVNFPLTAAAVIVACLLFGTVFGFVKKRFITAFGILFGVYAAAVFIFRERFCNGLANVINIYLARVQQEYVEKPYINVLYPETVAADTTIFIIITAIFISMVYCYGIIGESNLPAVLVVSVPPVELCLYFGLAPNYVAFFAVLASWFAVFALDLSMPETNKAYKKASAQCGLAAAAAVVLCGLTAMLLIQLSGYSRPAVLDDINQSVTDYFQTKSFNEVIEEIKLPQLIKGSGAINHGKLGENGNITFDEKTVLQVTLPKTSETTYLRGFVGSNYTGSSWKELSADNIAELEDINASFATDGLNTLLMGSYNLKLTGNRLPEYSFSIKNINAGKEYLYMPYNLVPESVSRYKITNDAFVSDGSTTWFGRVYDPSSIYGYRMLMTSPWTVPSGTLNADQSSYQNFVNANYLAVPDDFKAADAVFTDKYYEFISAEAEETGKSTLTSSVVFGRKLYYIKSWLRDNCEYSLNAGKLPSGKDFADYFVTETQKGSCSHFATAAALLCRYAGIPARYVEGYVVKTGDFSEDTPFGSSEAIDVTDTRAHAWVEVYINGFGWYPVEFTSGYGNVQTAMTTAPVIEELEGDETNAAEETIVTTVDDVNITDESKLDTTQENAANQTQTEVISESALTEEALPEETLPQQDAETENATIGFSIFGQNGGGKRDVVYDLTAVVVIVFIISIAVAVIGLRRIIIVKAARRGLLADKKTAAKSIYRRFLRLTKAVGLNPQGELTCGEYIQRLSEQSRLFSDDTAEVIVKTALKAEFGGGIVTENDIREMNLAVSNAVKRYINSLNRVKRFLARYIIGLY